MKRRLTLLWCITIVDIMNTMNLNASGYKFPIQRENSEKLKDFVVKAETHIRLLKLPDGQEILKSYRKTGFLGFLIYIRSFRSFMKPLLHLIVNVKEN